MERPLALQELLALTRELNLHEDAVFSAVSSLLRSGLVILT
jgi:predicted DNA-binding transcriptional regulator